MSPGSSPQLPITPNAPAPPMMFGQNPQQKKPQQKSMQQTYLGADTLPSPAMRQGKTLLGQ